VLNVSIAKVDQQEGIAEQYYYYGIDPVVKVTMECELLLLTAWERGTYDQETEEWSQEYPPLVPVEVLRSLQEVAPEALRSGDIKRLDQRST